MLLLYLGAMAAALGWVAARRRWRLTAAAIAVALFGVGWAGAVEAARPFSGLAYAVLGVGLWRRMPDVAGAGLARVGLWGMAGGLALFGGTGEIQRFFRQTDPPAPIARLAGGLAVSAWWPLFAAALVVLGLRRGLRPARIGGLAVAGLAVLKVLVFDLASLDALYRVASVFILGFVSLGLAYLYHRQPRRSAP